MNTRRTPRLLVHTILLLLALASIAAPTIPTASAAVRVRFRAADCEYDVPKPYVEGDDYECGYVTAPMWTDRNSSETVRLFTIRFFATGQRPADEPLIFLNGGPGDTVGKVLSYFKLDSNFFGDLLERQDIILFDQRGVGASTPSLDCGNRNLLSCASRLENRGFDLAAFTSERSAGDVAAIAEAFRADQVDLYGVSYGTRLGLLTLRDNPDLVRSTILSSISAPSAHGITERVIGLNDAMNRMFDECDVDQACGEGFPDLEGSFEIAVESLADDPMRISGENISGETVQMTIGAKEFMSVLFLAISNSFTLPYVPDLIQSVAEGDDAVLSLMAPIFLPSLGSTFGEQVDPGQDSSSGMVITAYFCQDIIPYAPYEDVEAILEDRSLLPEVRTYFAPDLTDTMYEVCDRLDLDASDPDANDAVESDIPVLLISGAYDPRTPLSNTELTEAALTNATSVIFAGGSHAPEFSDPRCALPMMTEFLDDPGSRIDTSCADDPVEFEPL